MTQAAVTTQVPARDRAGQAAPAAGALDLGDTAITTRLTAFLARQLGGDVRLEDVSRLPGGLSWITMMFTVCASAAPGFERRRLVVKIGSPQGLMAPYSARPQAAALRACSGSAVPVPELLWHDDDASILGAPFLVMDRVEGGELNPFVRGFGVPHGTALGPVGVQFADVLAALHRLPPDRLAASGATAGEAARHVHDAGAVPAASGEQQVEAWRVHRLRWARRPYPLVDLAEAWLRRCSPRPVREVIVHGDYRVGNFLVQGGGITAILDWEMTHRGDPHEDLCWVLLPELRLRGLIASDDFLARYQAQGGAEVQAEALRYYRVFSLYKMAVINMGAIAGLEAGSKDLRMACLGFNVPMYLDRLGRALQEVL